MISAAVFVFAFAGIESVRTSGDGTHSHSYSFDKGDMTSKPSAGNRPKWYALCLIMKL